MLKQLRKNIGNMFGWRTTRKILVFESVDWGCVRMPSIQAFLWLEEAGLDLMRRDAARFCRYDMLASV